MSARREPVRFERNHGEQRNTLRKADAKISTLNRSPSWPPRGTPASGTMIESPRESAR